MGRGSYYGGSTIIGPNTNWSGQTKKKRKISVYRKKPLRVQKQVKLDFLHIVINAELEGRVIEKIPRKSKAVLTELVRNKGGIHQWAKSQRQYKEIKAKKLSRMQEKNVESKKVVVHDEEV